MSMSPASLVCSTYLLDTSPYKTISSSRADTKSMSLKLCHTHLLSRDIMWGSMSSGRHAPGIGGSSDNPCQSHSPWVSKDPLLLSEGDILLHGPCGGRARVIPSSLLRGPRLLPWVSFPLLPPSSKYPRESCGVSPPPPHTPSRFLPQEAKVTWD